MFNSLYNDRVCWQWRVSYQLDTPPPDTTPSQLPDRWTTVTVLTKQPSNKWWLNHVVTDLPAVTGSLFGRHLSRDEVALIGTKYLVRGKGQRATDVQRAALACGDSGEWRLAHARNSPPFVLLSNFIGARKWDYAAPVEMRHAAGHSDVENSWDIY